MFPCIIIPILVFQSFLFYSDVCCSISRTFIFCGTWLKTGVFDLRNTCIACDGSMRKDYHISRHFVFPELFNLSFYVIVCDNCKLRSLFPAMNAKQRTAIYEKEYFSCASGSNEGRDYEKYRHDRLRIYSNKIQRIKRYAPTARKLIDIGAGYGDFLKLCKDEFEIHGLELSAFAAKKAFENHGIDVRQGMAEDVSQFDCVFDVIHMHHVFEHLHDPIKFLNLIKDKMQKDSIFLFEVPHQFEELNFKIRDIVGKPSVLKGLYAIHHPYFYTVRSLELMLEKNGFEIIALDSCPPERKYYLVDHPVKRIFRLMLYFLYKLFERGPVIEVICRLKG